MKNNLKVLVVDDSPTFQSYVSALLIDAGFEAIVFGTLAETMAYLESEPSLICSVLDYCLPDAPKGEVIDSVLQSGYRAIVLTGNADKNLREELLKKGIVDYILKDSAVSLAFLVPLLNRLVQNTNKTALVVDDSPVITQYLTELLERQYLNVVTASNGLEALEVLENTWEVNLVITDNDMPLMNGLELTQHLRLNKTRDELAIIGLSASNNPDLIPQFLKAGANDYLNKPFNQEELYCRIHAVLDMQDASEQLYFLANRDDLTGLWNRRYFFNFTDQNPAPFKSIAMIDIDHFKMINEQFGHNGGDHALKSIGQMLNTAFSSALPARFGGEEFVVLCTGNSDVFNAELEAFRNELENTTIHYEGQPMRLTTSIGVASGEQSLPQLLKSADDKLYAAKNNGRNNIIY
ncbi:response regulator [Enterovibrio makurazakiensis]|uniref:GGDEF domain-containing response regulator n=1 Tax=Enterovibrio makurazakiensis TaxID=2910232 RepID=UPI003D2605E1